MPEFLLSLILIDRAKFCKFFIKQCAEKWKHTRPRRVLRWTRTWDFRRYRIPSPQQQLLGYGVPYIAFYLIGLKIACLEHIINRDDYILRSPIFWQDLKHIYNISHINFDNCAKLFHVSILPLIIGYSISHECLLLYYLSSLYLHSFRLHYKVHLDHLKKSHSGVFWLLKILS